MWNKNKSPSPPLIGMEVTLQPNNTIQFRSHLPTKVSDYNNLSVQVDSFVKILLNTLQPHVVGYVLAGMQAQIEKYEPPILTELSKHMLILNAYIGQNIAKATGPAIHPIAALHDKGNHS